MIAHHIHDALAQVQRLQTLILEKRQFRGYSGTARMISGTTAFLGCMLMSSASFQKTETAHLMMWVMILCSALLLNYGALMLWYIQLPDDERKTVRVRPVLDAFPALITGGFLSTALLLRGYPDLLFGAWMCCYGLAHTGCRRDLPRGNWFVGLYYMFCGAFFMLWQKTSFLNPWPAGMVFLIGEWAGGMVFHRHKYAGAEVDDEL